MDTQSSNLPQKKKLPPKKIIQIYQNTMSDQYFQSKISNRTFTSIIHYYFSNAQITESTITQLVNQFYQIRPQVAYKMIQKAIIIKQNKQIIEKYLQQKYEVKKNFIGGCRDWLVFRARVTKWSLNRSLGFFGHNKKIQKKSKLQLLRFLKSYLRNDDNYFNFYIVERDLKNQEYIRKFISEKLNKTQNFYDSTQVYKFLYQLGNKKNGQGPTPHQQKQMISAIDRNKDGKISDDQLINFYVKEMKPKLDSQTVIKIKQAILLVMQYDKDKDYYFNSEQARDFVKVYICQSQEQQKIDKCLIRFMDEYDRDKDGKISIAEIITQNQDIRMNVLSSKIKEKMNIQQSNV